MPCVKFKQVASEDDGGIDGRKASDESSEREDSQKDSDIE